MRAEEGDGSDWRARAAVSGKARRCARACGWERAKRARGPRVAFWAEVWAVRGKAREWLGPRGWAGALGWTEAGPRSRVGLLDRARLVGLSAGVVWAGFGLS